jgi:hypothetical protein
MKRVNYIISSVKSLIFGEKDVLCDDSLNCWDYTSSVVELGNEHGISLEWHWQGNTDVLGEIHAQCHLVQHKSRTDSNVRNLFVNINYYTLQKSRNIATSRNRVVYNEGFVIYVKEKKPCSLGWGYVCCLINEGLAWYLQAGETGCNVTRLSFTNQCFVYPTKNIDIVVSELKQNSH